MCALLSAYIKLTQKWVPKMYSEAFLNPTVLSFWLWPCLTKTFPVRSESFAKAVNWEVCIVYSVMLAYRIVVIFCDNPCLPVNPTHLICWGRSCIFMVKLQPQFRDATYTKDGHNISDDPAVGVVTTIMWN